MKTKMLILLLVCFQGIAYSQTNFILSLEDARKYALEYNKNLKNADLAMQKAQMALREAIANGLPQVNASMDYSNALGAKISIRFNESMPASEIDIKPQSNLVVNVNQLIFSGNYIVGVQTAKLYKNISEISQEKSELEVLSQVTDGYYLVLVSEELLKLLEQNLDNLNDLYSKTAVLESVGMIETTDLDQLFVQVSSMQDAVKSAERQLELATNLLKLQLGTPVETGLELTGQLKDYIAELAGKVPVAETFDINQNIDYQLMNKQELVSLKMIDMQRANALPSLAGFYNYTYKVLKPDFDMSPANMVGLKLNIPVFSSGMRYAKTQQARIDLETTQNNKLLLNDQLEIQEKQLRFNYNTALETFTNKNSNVEVSRRVYSSLKLKYEQGIISGLDLITADNNYLRAETDYISSILNLLQTGVQLQKLYGNIN